MNTFIVCFAESDKDAFNENVAKLRQAFPKGALSPRPRIHAVELTTEEDVISLANGMDFIESVELDNVQQLISPPGAKVQ